LFGAFLPITGVSFMLELPQCNSKIFRHTLMSFQKKTHTNGGRTIFLYLPIIINNIEPKKYAKIFKISGIFCV